MSQPPPDVLPLPRTKQTYGAGDMIGGKYRLESLLGRGGMGEVWTATNETLAVQRAVKLIRSEADSPENTDRLLHEARAAARLADPAIVRVFDFGKTQHGDPFLVMEVLRGEDLASAIRRKERLSATRAVRILLPVIRALGLAHLHGIVHRDLKPENIFLTKSADGRIQPKLLDFGIAKLKDMRSLRLTMDGSVMGSPLYMAPEQARGEEVDERADIWALCVMLYEVITGQPPFLGETRSEVFTAATRSTPKSLVTLGMGDEVLWKILLKGLSKKPDDRYQTMRELGQALAGWLLLHKVSDDIAGGSLEASWFRESPQSFLSSTLPPGRPSLVAPPRIWPLPDVSNLLGPPPSTEAAPPTLNAIAEGANLAVVMEEASQSSRNPWPQWLRTSSQRWLAAASVAFIASLPWLLQESPPAPSVAEKPPVTAASAVASTAVTATGTPPATDSQTGAHSQKPQPLTITEVSIFDRTPDASPEPVLDSGAMASSPKQPDRATKPSPSEARPVRKRAAKAARHRAEKKRRSRLMDPFQ